MTHPYDSRAAKILFHTYWSSTGWKKNPATPPEDLAYAKSKGVMFDAGPFSHDDLVAGAIKLAATIPTRQVAQAFLYSLTSRDLAYRSALGSYAHTFWMPFHSFVNDSSPFCHTCGSCEKQESTDYNVLNFERLKWGGVRHHSPLYQLFDLTEFLKLPEVKAKGSDKDIFHRVIKDIVALPADARPRDIEKIMAVHIKSNRWERHIIIHILGYCGILQPGNQPGFFREYTWYRKRADRPVSKIDWSYPVSWWQGRDGVNRDALAHYFD